MSDQRLHRIVLVQPGANAQFTRRILGVARALGCSIDISTTAHSFFERPDHSGETLIIPSGLLGETFDSSHYRNIIEFGERSLPFEQPSGPALWSCSGNPIASPHAAFIIRSVCKAESNGKYVGWSSSHFSIECPSKNLSSEFFAVAKRLRVTSIPAVANFLEATKSILLVAEGRSRSEAHIWCDGNSLCIDWLVDEVQMSRSELGSLFLNVPSSFHLVTSGTNHRGRSIHITARFLIGQDAGHTKGVVIVGSQTRSDTDGKTLPKSWEKIA